MLLIFFSSNLKTLMKCLQYLDPVLQHQPSEERHLIRIQFLLLLVLFLVLETELGARATRTLGKNNFSHSFLYEKLL